jgi:hypothetical protein
MGDESIEARQGKAESLLARVDERTVAIQQELQQIRERLHDGFVSKSEAAELRSRIRAVEVSVASIFQNKAVAQERIWRVLGGVFVGVVMLLIGSVSWWQSK